MLLLDAACELILFFLVLKNAKLEVEAAAVRLQSAESEVKYLHSMTERMILTQEEMVCSNYVLQNLSLIIWRLSH